MTVLGPSFERYAGPRKSRRQHKRRRRTVAAQGIDGRAGSHAADAVKYKRVHALPRFLDRVFVSARHIRFCGLARNIVKRFPLVDNRAGIALIDSLVRRAVPH